MHRLGLKLWNAPKWAIALGSGLLMACAPEPLNLWGLAWIALIPFWVLVISTPAQNRKCTLLYATLWGLGYHGIAISWITGLHPLTWLGMSWFVSVIVTAFCWVFITLWGTATTVVWAWSMSQIAHLRGVTAWTRVLAGTALWCSLEWLLTLTPLNWTSLSYTQSPGNLWAVHLGQLSGPLTVTAAIVACNGLLAEAWMRWRHRTERLRPLLVSVLLLVIGIHGIGAWLASRPLQDVDTAKLTIGIIQGNVPTRIKLSAEGGRRAIASYNRGYLELADQQVDAVLTPEGAIPFLWDVYRETSSSITRAIATEKVPVWLGTFVSKGTTYTQSLLSLDQNGDIVGRYDKIKLVPLGEYIPLRNILGGLIDRLSPIEAVMIPGSERQQFETPFGRAIGSICYESAYPNYFRAQAAQGGQFILTASNLDPYSEVLMMQHQAHDIMRAIETDRWAARATNTGYSGFVDPHGRVVWRSHPLTYETHADTIYRRQTQTLYVRWGNWLTPVLILVTVVMIGLAVVRPA